MTHRVRYSRIVIACALLACVVGSPGCGTVRVVDWPAPSTDCPTEYDVAVVAELLGQESVGQPERERLRLQAVATRVADAAAYCAAGEQL